MEKYGTIFDSTFNLQKNRVRNLICAYFDNPRLVKFKNSDSTSIYLSSITSQLLKNKQFIVATGPLDKSPISTVKYLNDIQWVSFQTRMLDRNKSNISFSYEPKKSVEYSVPIVIKKRSEKISEYSCVEYGIMVSLLHDNQNIYEYPDAGTLNQALETFKTIVTFM